MYSNIYKKEMQYIMETIIIDLVKAKRPPHPMKKEIEYWHEALEDLTEEDVCENWKYDDRIFSSFYFSLNGRDKQKKVKQFIYDNNLRIIQHGYKNKEVDKLRIKHEQEIKRMNAKIKELNLKNYSIDYALLFDNKYFKTRLYHNRKEIIY
jgi:hypothetical protein